MLFNKFRKSNESEVVIDYLHALIKGEETVKSAVSDPKVMN